MKNIEIQTTQNVSIDYEIAGAGTRLFAFFVDFLLMWLVYGILIGIESMINETFFTYFIYTVAIIFTSFYTLFFEIYLQGQTPGKKLLGIRVIKTDGTELTFKDYFSRWALRILDIYMTLGSLAIILINSSEKGQRLGDMAAGTTVVKEKGLQSFSLEQIVELNNQNNYVPVYQEVNALNDEFVLLIKNTLIRERNFPNKAHQEALELMFLKTQELMNADLKGATYAQRKLALKQVIKDYIMMTR